MAKKKNNPDSASISQNLPEMRCAHRKFAGRFALFVDSEQSLPPNRSAARISHPDHRYSHRLGGYDTSDRSQVAWPRIKASRW